MAIDRFSLRSLIPMVSYMRLPTTFLLSTFFTMAEAVDSDTIDVDIERDGRQMAVFVSPLVEGHVVKDQGYVTSTFKPAYIKEKMNITPLDLMTRDPGTTVYAPQGSWDDRIAKRLTGNTEKLMKRIIRTEEWMAAQALTTGACTVKGDGVNRQIDFNMLTSHKVTIAGATDKWSDLTNSRPDKDLKTWVQLILEDSGLNADIVICGVNAAQNFIENAEIRKQLDNRRMEMGRIGTTMRNQGARKIAELYDPDVDIWTYPSKYYDVATSSYKYLIPENMVLVGCTEARCERRYARIQDLDAGGNYAMPYFPKSWTTKDPSARWLMLQSAPLPLPVQIDGFVAATVQDAA